MRKDPDPRKVSHADRLGTASEDLAHHARFEIPQKACGLCGISHLRGIRRIN